MIIQEHRLRALCRTDSGGVEAARFQAALDKSTGDPVPVEFEIGLGEIQTFDVPRKECEFYAQIAKEEAQPEDDLLEYLHERMHGWARFNRRKMCEKLREAMVEYRPNPLGVVIIWPLCPPSNIPVDVVERYLRKYGN